MTPNEYQELSLRSEPTREDYNRACPRLNHPTGIRLIHSALGINTEAGELMDCVKKTLIYNQDFDFRNFKEELGDLLWYIAIGASACGITIEQLMIDNIEKLKIRYPEKFTEEHAKERLDKKT